MPMLVTLQQASDHLRRDTTDDDADLTLKIKAASRAVINYLKSGASVIVFDSFGEVVILSDGLPDAPEDIQMATLLLLSIFYKDREGQNERMDNWQLGYLPMPVQSLLYHYRKPACE